MIQMYSLGDLLSGLRHPQRGIVELNSLFHRARSNEPYYDQGIDVFEQDWDNLIILDACRADEYERQRLSGGTLMRRRSRAGATNEFLAANFRDRQLFDTVYVSANPWFVRLRDDLNSAVHEFVNVRGKQETSEDDGFDELTIGPDAVTEVAKDAAGSYPRKRLVIHYIQPHTPYIGPTGREEFEVTRGMWNQVKESDVSDETLRRAYRENLELVLNSVRDLIPKLPGRTVLTADHGEYLGERSGPLPVKTYGHFRGLYTDPLVDVPWHVFDGDSRKDIRSEQPSSDTNDESVDEQLLALGYKV